MMSVPKSAEHAASPLDLQANQPDAPGVKEAGVKAAAQAEAGARFQAEAGRGRTSLSREFVEFLAANKKWWLIPIVLAVLLIGALVVLGGSAAAPFIYTLF
jgi:hypothetical protein